MTNCTRCKAPLKDGQMFCIKCGTSVPTPPSTPLSTPTSGYAAPPSSAASAATPSTSANSTPSSAPSSSSPFSSSSTPAWGSTPAVPSSASASAPAVPSSASASAPAVPSSASASAPAVPSSASDSASSSSAPFTPAPTSASASTVPSSASDSASASSSASASDSAPASPPANSPAASSASATSNPFSNAAASAIAAISKNKLPVIIVAAVVAVALVAGLIFLRPRQTENVTGDLTLPVAAQLADGDSTPTADDVITHLRNQGFTSVEKKTEFSSGEPGDFIRYEGVNEGDVIDDPSTPITVVASAGPGVPEGTVGSSKDDATAAVSDMGVPVSFADVVVSSSYNADPGTVVVSSPTDGTALVSDDRDRGIVFGVAAEGKGVGIDLVGMDKDEARKALESDGFTVTLKPRYSSKDYVDKMVTSSPEPGVETSSKNVTLYYGVDASQTKSLFTEDGAMKMPDSMIAGRYCTADGSDCFTLDAGEVNGYETISASNGIMDDSNDMYNELLVSDSLQGPSAAPGQYGLNNRLIDTDSGAFELFPYASIAAEYCNGTLAIMNGVPTPTCSSGTWTTDTSSSSTSTTSESTYRMNPYYLYYPVGTDMEKVESTNIFDDDSLAEAAKQEAVDSTRPFIVMRDSSLYDTTEVAQTSAPKNENNIAFDPFGPLLLGDDGKLKDGKVAFKPAVSNETVYYLDEDSLINSWVENAASDDTTNSTNSNDSENSSTTQAASMTFDDIKKAVDGGDFSAIAGDFCTKSGDCVNISDTGWLTVKSGNIRDLKGSQLSPSTMWWGSGDFEARDDVLYLMGPESDFGCDGVSTTGWDSWSDYNCITANMHYPDQMFYIPAGTTLESLSGIAGTLLPNEMSDWTAPDTTEDYLYVPWIHANIGPSDSYVYYRAS